MSSGDFPSGGQIAYEVLESLRQTNSLDGEDYSNIVVSSPEMGIDDVFDPNIIFERQFASLYWPSGSPEHDRQFEMVAVQSASALETAAGVTEVRQAILGARIGQAALDRVPPETNAFWEAFSLQSVPISPLLVASERCALRGLPLAVCQVSRVLESDIAPVDSRIMHLWYPMFISPKPVLVALKRAVRKVVEQEASLVEQAGGQTKEENGKNNGNDR